MMSNLNSNMTSQFPLAIPTRSKGPQARLVLRGADGAALKQWLIKQSKCTLGSDPECAIRCDLPGIAAYHVLIVVGQRQTFLRSLAPKLTRDGVTVNELLLSDDSNTFEIAGHQFELTRQDSAGQLPPADGAGTRMRFAVSRPLETKTASAKSGSPTVIAKGEHSDLLPAGADTATPRWVSRIVRDAILPLENRLREVMQPIENLQSEVRREKRRRLAEEQRRERMQEEKVEQPKLDAATVEAQVKQQVSAITARQSSSLDVITERISDVNQQLTSIERLVAAEQDAPPPPMDPQITAEIEAQSSSVQKLQEGFVAVAGAMSALQDSQRETAEHDAQWKTDIQGKLEALQGAVESMHTRSLPEVEQLSDEQLNQYAEQLETCQSTFAVVAPDAEAFSHQGVAAQSIAEEWDISILSKIESPVELEKDTPLPQKEELKTPLDVTTDDTDTALETIQPETPELTISSEPIESADQQNEHSSASLPGADDFDHDWDHSIEIVSVEEVEDEPAEANAADDDEFPIIPQAFAAAALPQSDGTANAEPFATADEQPDEAANLFSNEARSPWENEASQVSENIDSPDDFSPTAPGNDLELDTQAGLAPEPSSEHDTNTEEAGEAATLPSWWDERTTDNASIENESPAESEETGFAEQEFAAASPWDLDTAAWPETDEQPEQQPQAIAPENNSPASPEPLAVDAQPQEIESEQVIEQDHAGAVENPFIQEPQTLASGDTTEEDSNESAFQLIDNLNDAIDNDAAADDEAFPTANLFAGTPTTTAEQAPAAEDEFETELATPDADGGQTPEDSNDDSFPTMNLMSGAFGNETEDENAPLESPVDETQAAVPETEAASLAVERKLEPAGNDSDAEDAAPWTDDQSAATDIDAAAADQVAEGPIADQSQTPEDVTPAQVANNALELPTEKSLADGDSEDDSVEDYMRRLLARMRGEEEPTDSPSKEGGNPDLAINAPSKMIQEVTQSSSTEAAPPTDQVTAAVAPQNAGAEASKLSASVGSEQPDDGLTQAQRDMLEQKEEEARVLRRQQTANPGQLAAMRELANSTARTAIVKSNQRRVLSSLLLKSGIALVGLLVAIALIAINGFDLNIGLIATIAALLVAAIWGWDAVTSLNHFRQVPATIPKADDGETATTDAQDTDTDQKPSQKTEL